MSRPLRIGLTGGIASGKSAVADLFDQRGVPVLDTDQIARDVVEPGTEGLAAVVAAFGPGVLAADGRLDRRALRERVFTHPGDRRKLEAILHPRIREELERRSAAAGGPYQVLVIPLLVEGTGQTRLDRVLVVDCPEETQVARLMARDGGTAEGARAILAAQASRAERLAIADDVIVNDGPREALAAEVERLDARYRRMAGLRARTPAAE